MFNDLYIEKNVFYRRKDERKNNTYITFNLTLSGI
jgi:hypothetical protein